jgi:hypothetical protein
VRLRSHCSKCRRAIAKASARFTQALAKAYAGCELGKLKGSVPPATDCIGAPDASTAGKLSKADAALTDGYQQGLRHFSRSIA